MPATSLEPVRAARLLIADNAPFTTEQRAWLSGFLGAALAPHLAFAPTPADLSRIAPEASSGPVLADNEDAPWHDPAMPAAERMQLAEGRPPAPRMMAAMAQQDCGQCGYGCAAYANALVRGKESRLDLCVPGGEETARLLEALAVELAPPAAGEAARSAPEPAPAAAVETAPGTARERPFTARLLGRERLSLSGSSKDTWHVELALGRDGPGYEPGDALGVFPRNDPGLVDQVIATLGASPDAPVRRRRFRELLLEELSVGQAPNALFELLSYLLGGNARQKARARPRRGSRRRRRPPRPSRGSPQVPPGPAAPRGLGRRARPAPAAPLLDLPPRRA